VIRDEYDEIQTIIEGSKNIEIIELLDDDVVMNDENDEVIEIGQFPPNIPSKDFFRYIVTAHFSTCKR
jgi:hypothetical protein